MSNISTVVGKNVREIRGTFTMEDLVTCGKVHGAKWSVGSVGRIESGDFKATLDTLILISQALGTLHDSEPISIERLLRTNDNTTQNIINWVKGGDLEVAPVENYITAGEERLAKSIGITGQCLREKSIDLWGKTIEDQRDMLAGHAASAQKRGRVTRQLLHDIKSTLVN